MKYEKFREIQNSMRAVTINSEFSLPGLMYSDCHVTFELMYYSIMNICLKLLATPSSLTNENTKL